MKKILLFVFVLLICAGGYFLYTKFITKNLITTPEYGLLADVATWYPSAPWSKPVEASQTTFYGTLSGQSIHATVKVTQSFLDHFEDMKTLQTKGFILDNNLSADGPGSSTWGYVKKDNKTQQLLLFSYKTQPTDTNPNEPLQFNCPCNMTITIFISYPSPLPSPTIANPASVNCTKVGGILSIKKRGDGGEYGLCYFGDNMQCEEWALFKGNCPIGGVKTTGFDTIEEKYCAWLGGKTVAEPHATCTLPSGTSCDNLALYNGTCQ